MSGYVPLHVHSQYSILDSTASIGHLVQATQAFGLSSLALTDKGNLHGVIEFYKKCKAAKIHPILGCELWMSLDHRKKKKKEPGIPAGFPFVLFAMNHQGYQNLCKLSSLGYLEGFYYYPRIDKELLSQYHEGLLCLIGSWGSLLSYYILREKNSEWEKEIKWYLELFQDRLYFEVQRTSLHLEGFSQESWVLQKAQGYASDLKKIENHLLQASKTYSIPLVACNEIYYLQAQDWKAHEILLNVASGEPCEIWERDAQGNPRNLVFNPKRKILPSRDFYFKSPQEMEQLFADLPQALKTTEEIAQRCQLELDFQTKHYPVFLPPSLQEKSYTKEEREKKTAEYLYSLCMEQIPKKYTPERLAKVQEKYPQKDPLEVVKERLDHEFSILSSKGMCDYLLIVYDFIAWAKKQKIPVGPGRGSAAGSIIAYLTGITNIEPLRFHLFFERFINPERVSYPDIDVDICMERRGEVIDYMIQKYGKDRVAQIITFGTMKAKMAIKDVGRVLSVPLSKVNHIAKLVPEEGNMTLERALDIDPDLKEIYEKDTEASRIIDMAKKMEGSLRNTSIHAAGLIISEVPILEHVPVCTAKDTDMVVTQFAMKPVEEVGMLKIDFLGLKTLSCIQKCAEAVQKNTKKEIDPYNLPLEDAPTFALLTQGKTLGVFQVESAGMQDLLRQLKVDHFEEVIAVGALYRPGPMDMIPSFINRKYKREETQIDHPWMKEILEETYGVMVYQEQVMQIASKLAGYSLGKGDVLRRAMGKKDHQEMARQKKQFIEGCIEKGIEAKTAEIIFEKIEKFASYGFNKSHAAAYAYLTYVTAYFKANYPKEWMAALMTCDADDLSKIAKFIREAQSLQIAILPPDINESGLEFAATPQGIRFAMSGIKGVGLAVVEAILEERKRQGPFLSLEDFIQRIDSSKVGKKGIELLIAAGAFDFTQETRSHLKADLEARYERIIQEKKEQEKGVMTLFSLLDKPPELKICEPIPIEDASKKELLHQERELLGFYLTAHPLDLHQPLLKELGCVSLKDVENKKNEWVKVAFILEEIQYKLSSKSQRKLAILTISDGLEKYEIPLFGEVYEKNAELLQENRLLIGLLYWEEKEQKTRILCRHLQDLEQVDKEKLEEEKKKLQSFQKMEKKKTQEIEKEYLLKIALDLEKIRMSHILELKGLFQKYPGKVPLEIHFEVQQNSFASLQIEKRMGVDLNPNFLYDLKAYPFFLRYEIKDLK